MLEAIQVARDIVIILAAIIIVCIVVVVGKAVLDLVRKIEGLRLFVVDAATGVTNPIKGAALAIRRIARAHRKS